MYQDKVDNKIFPPRKESYLLDYPNESDLSDFLYYVKHEAAMAEIYFDDDVEKLDDETIQLFKQNGKLLHKNNTRCDLMLVLRDNGKVIGFIELRLSKNSEMLPQLFSLFMNESYRRKGLSNLMMVYALDFLVHSGQNNMTVSPTAESLTVYNKFAFYPPEFDEDNDALKKWFEKTESGRLDCLEDDPSEFLMMDLRNQFCRETFESHCKKASQNFVKFDISKPLKDDLKTDVFEWRKKAATPTSLSKSGLSVLNTLEDKKKRKVDQIDSELSQDTGPKPPD
jgi:predicted acetyltransferase